MTIYLDYNASTPIDQRVLDLMIEVYKDYYGNASSRTHVFGQRASEVVEKGRSQVASIIGTNKNEVIFTSGATESDNLAILGLAQWGRENYRNHILSTNIEHKAVLEPLEYLSRHGFEIELVPVSTSGRIDAKHVISRVRPDTLLVSMMHANNETGIIQPVKEVGDYLKNTDTYFHVDAAQTYGKLVDELRSIKCDLLSISGHKIYGPQGIGALVVRFKNYKRVPLKPILYGGGQEYGLRPGTLPVALIAGLGLASEHAEKEYIPRAKKCLEIKQTILNQFKTVKHVINGDQKYAMPHVINLSIPAVDSEALMLAVRDELAISNGSACTSKDYKPSHVLEAMGIERIIIDSTLRISWGEHSEKIDLNTLIQNISFLQG
jgi:cysteine desulfurase